MACTDALSADLTLDPDAVRRLGYRAVDAIADRLAGLDAAPVGQPASRRELEARLREPLPEQGDDPQAVLDAAIHDVLTPGLKIDHPRFFGFVPGPSNPIGALSDALAAGFNLFAGTWQAAPGAAVVELVVLDWLRDLFEMPAGTEGLFVSGGSAANLTALTVALEERAGAARARAIVYLCGEAHSSLQRALRVLGVRSRVLAVDREQRLVPSDVAAAVSSDRAAGRLPVCVIATAGTTGTGAVDPLQELRTLCDREALWLHVDGAYGAPAVLCERGRAQLPGLGLADSLAVDPHKWLFQPLETGCLLIRDGAALERSFRTTPAYLRDAAACGEEVNFADRGIQLTRQFRALKLWMSFKVFGAAAFGAAIERGIELAEYAEAVIADHPAWELVTGARLGIVTFRPTTGDDELTAGLPAAALSDGLAYLSTTRVAGRPVLRLCTINPRTTRADVERTIDRLAALAQGAHT